MTRSESSFRKEDEFRGFRRLYEKDRRRYSAVIKKQGVSHYLALRYDNKAPREVQLQVSEYGPVLEYYSEETRDSGVPLIELERRVDTNDRYFDVKNVTGTSAASGR